jgi:hypothetical protein
MIKLIQLFELLSFLLTATTTAFASFYTHGESSRPNVKIDRFGEGRSRRWLPSGPLHLKRANFPGDISDGFPSSQHQSLNGFAMSPPEVLPSLKSGGKDVSSLEGYDSSDDLSQLLDRVNNIPGYGQSVVGGVGAGVDDLNAALVASAAARPEALKLSSAETFNAFKESTEANLEVVKASTAATLEASREGILSAKREIVDKAVEIYSSETFQTQQTKLMDVGQRFSSVMETKYHLPELSESIMRGELLKNFMDYISDRYQAFVDAMDFKTNASFLALLVTVFWASNARRDGIEYGKLQAQGTIDSLQDKLESTKAAAKTETDMTTTELKDLRKQLVGDIRTGKALFLKSFFCIELTITLSIRVRMR